MKKIIILALLGVFLLTVPTNVLALELQRDKNVATYIVFPLIDSSDDVSYQSGATSPDSEIDSWADGAAPDGFADCTNEATEIGTTGIYYLSLSNTEMNADYIVIQIKASDANTQTLLINTKIKTDVSSILTDTAAMDTADELRTLLTGGTSAVSILTTSDNIGINWGDVSNPTTAVNLSGTNIKTDQVVASVSGAVGSVTGGVTVTTNNDKTGYTASTVSDKTGYALADGTSDAVIADAVLNAATATYGSAGSYGLLLETDLDATISSRGTSTLTAANVWQTDLSGYTTANQAGTYLHDTRDTVNTNLDTTVSSRGTSTLTESSNIGINWADVSNPTTTLNLSGTTISTSQAVASVAGAVNSVTSGVTVTTNNDKTGYTVSTVSDKTGYSLTQTFPTNFSSLAITGAGAVTAGTVGDKTGYTVSTVSDKTGYSLTQGFPTNFSSLAITAGGAVTAGTVSDKTGYSLSQAFPTNFSVLAISATTGKVTVGTNDDKTGYALTQTFPSNFEHLAITDNTGYVTVGTNNDKTGYTVSTVSDKTGYTISGASAGNYSEIGTDTWSATTRTLTAIDEDVTTLDLNGTMVGGLTNWDKTGYRLSATGIDDLWEETQAGHTTAGTFGKYLDTQLSTLTVSASVTEEDKDDIASRTWEETQAGHTTAGTMGKKMNEMPTPYNVGP